METLAVRARRRRVRQRLPPARAGDGPRRRGGRARLAVTAGSTRGLGAARRPGRRAGLRPRRGPHARRRRRRDLQPELHARRGHGGRSPPRRETALACAASSCEKPLARNLAEARRVVELAREVGAPTAYFENQIHMKMLQSARAAARRRRSRAMGPLTLVRAAEEHGGPHSAWFWDPTLQGGGVLSDMGCHSLAVGRYLLTPPGRPLGFLEPLTVSCDVGLLKWGQPRWRDELRALHGVDYARTPAEDFATGIVTYRNPETGQHVKAQFTVSWMYDKQGLRLLVDGLGPGYALEANSLRSPLEVFIGDAAAASVGRRRARAREGDRVARPARDPTQRARPLRVHRRERRRRGCVPRRPLGAARLRRRLRDRAAHDGCVPVGGGRAGRRPHRRRHPRAPRRLRPADPAGARRRGARDADLRGAQVSAPNGPRPIWSRTVTTGGFVRVRRCQFAPSTTSV